VANVALNKQVAEAVRNRAEVTNGNHISYTGSEGFAYFKWPGTLTIDLESVQSLTCIRFLLWDGLGRPGARRHPRIYLYRLLVSEDSITWKVLHDTGKDGYNGWQVINLRDPIPARYVRIHGIWNIANTDFHVVEVEAHDSDPPPLERESSLQRTISLNEIQLEEGDGSLWSSQVLGIVASIEELVQSTNLLNAEPFNDLISQLRVRVNDISTVERHMDAIRREVTAPVARNVASLSKFSFWQLVVGLIGGILGVLGLIVMLFGK